MVWCSTSFLKKTPIPRSERCSTKWSSSPACSRLWIATSAFETFLFQILRADAFFLVRWHSSTMPFEPIRSSRLVGCCDPGEIFEQAIWVDDPECVGRRYHLRRIVLRLDQPTRNGETEIILITNLPDTALAGLCC